MDRKLLLIEFDEFPDDETTLLLSPVPMSKFKAIVAAFEPASQTLPDELGVLCDELAPLLVSWSFKEKADRKGMDARDPNYLLGLARAWVMAVRNVPVPLARRSSGGERSPADSPSAAVADPT